MKKWKRLLSVLLTLMLLIGMTPLNGAEAACKHKWGPKQYDYANGEWSCINPHFWFQECTKCGDGRDGMEYGPHKFGGWETTRKATCTEEGRERRVCKLCKKTETRSTGLAPHQYGSWYRRGLPTCTEPGLNARECVVCGAGQFENVEPLGHDWGEWYVVRQPSADQKGLEERKCARCGIVEQREFDGAPEGAPAPEGTPAPVSFSISKQVVSTPANGEKYIPGESIQYEIVITCESGPVEHFYVTDPLVKGFSPVLSGEGLVAGDSRSVTVYYHVTDEDAKRQTVENYAVVMWTVGGEFAGSVQSNTVSSPCGAEPSAMLLNARLISAATAGNGQYRSGDTLIFEATLTNDGVTDLYAAAMDKQIAAASGTPGMVNAASGLSLIPGASATIQHEHLITDDDVKTGITFTAVANARDPAGNALKPLTASVTVQPEYYLEDPVLTLSLANAPADGVAFAPGETMQFTVKYENPTIVDLRDMTVRGHVHDQPFSGGDGALGVSELASNIPLPRDASGTVSFSHAVTYADAARGFVTAYATLFASSNMTWCERDYMLYSNHISVPTALGDPELLVSLALANAPADGVAFREGEVALLTFTVTNHTGEDLADVGVKAHLDTAPATASVALASGETADAAPSLGYVITAMDVAAGCVYASGYANAVNALGDQYVGYSNSVAIPTGGMPMGVMADLSVTKAEESLPLNGTHYTEGETIAYRITFTNSGECTVYDVRVLDSLAGMGEIASAEKLEPGESRSCFYSHTVTAADVEKGFVANAALARFTAMDASMSAASNTVVSDTDGKPDPEDAPVFPWDLPEDPEPYVGTIDPGLLSKGDAWCRRTLKGWNSNSASYESTFCAGHAATQDAAVIMLSAAGDDATRQMAYEYAISLWRADLDAMYAKLINAADDVARIHVMGEYAGFVSMMGNYEAALRALYPDAPHEVARVMASLWQEKVVALCTEVNGPAAAREDSFFLMEQAADAAENAAHCAAHVTEETAAAFACDEVFCQSHAFLFSMTGKLLKGENTAESWNRLYQMWMTELGKTYNTLYAAMGEEKGGVLMVERVMFEQWLASRSAQLIALYPDNLEIAAELLTRTVMDHVADLCALMK